MGPLRGLTLIEIVGMGPAPYAGMLLADLGARVIRVDRPGGSLFSYGNKLDLLNRNKECICVNLKSTDGIDIIKRLLKQADGLIEGFRPGTMEKLGLGPEVCLALNPGLVYGRVTGWGQTGPLAHAAGHDLNYVALTGVTHAFGPAGAKPSVTLPLIGDFAGGGLFLALGMVSALLEAAKSGKGQVIDSAIIDGVSHMMSSIYAAQQIGFWSTQRGTNLLDGGAPFYDVYECRDGQYLSVGAIEPKFYAALLQGLGLANESLPEQMDQSHWPEMKKRFGEILLTKTRDEWLGVFAPLDTCVGPVLNPEELRQHPHHVARQTYLSDEGVWQPAPAPRFSRTIADDVRAPAAIGAQTQAVLKSLGYSPEQISRFQESGATA